jgi:dienelactone hydrolase
MAEILLFHHALGQTPGFLALAEELRSAGHVVHAPDLYDGRTFDGLDEGVAHAEEIGFDSILSRGRAAAEELPYGLVYAGLSLGVMPAQMLAQTRPGARGALLLHSAVPLSAFGGRWPDRIPLQVHTMEGDEWGDVDVARELVGSVDGAELFLYPGDRHLFTDSGLADYDEAAARLLMARVAAFLDDLG